MKKPAFTGRPSLRRAAAAGQNLGLALKLLGKTWRRDVDSPNHVHSWERWAACGLPRSATTIDRDIRKGIPASRLAAYARCLGLTPEALGSPDTDIIKVLEVPAPASAEGIPSRVLAYRDKIPERYLEHNRETYIQELFALMQGVYRVFYVLEGVETVHRSAVWIHAADAHRLLVRGLFSMFGNENIFDAEMFRWHNNLHMHFLCENGLELGYILFVDPLRHHLVQRRDPFWLKGRGLTDRGLADNQPVTFAMRFEKLPLSGDLSLEDIYRRECDDLRDRPFVAPGEPDYDALRTEILAPDELL